MSANLAIVLVVAAVAAIAAILWLVDPLLLGLAAPVAVLRAVQLQHGSASARPSRNMGTDR